MKVSGFTIIRNALKYDYPVVEAITSILPICDEFIVCVGDSEDETLALIKSIDSPKIKIVHITDSSRQIIDANKGLLKHALPIHKQLHPKIPIRVEVLFLSLAPFHRQFLDLIFYII